jgi:hypothetical protein
MKKIETFSLFILVGKKINLIEDSRRLLHEKFINNLI